MARQKTRTLPAPLAQALRRFEKWRASRKFGTHIPDPLWDLAARLGRRYGVNRTSSVLRLDYYDLKRRVEADSAAVPATKSEAAFVEIVQASPTQSSGCRVEIEDARGTKMRIELENAGASELATLGRLFWGTDQ